MRVRRRVVEEEEEDHGEIQLIMMMISEFPLLEIIIINPHISLKEIQRTLSILYTRIGF